MCCGLGNARGLCRHLLIGMFKMVWCKLRRSATFVVEAVRRAVCSSSLPRCRPLVGGVGASLGVPPFPRRLQMVHDRRKLYHPQLLRVRAAYGGAAARLGRVAKRVGIVLGRSLVRDRLSDRVCAIGRLRGRLAAHTLRMCDDSSNDMRHTPWIDRSELCERADRPFPACLASCYRTVVY